MQLGFLWFYYLQSPTLDINVMIQKQKMGCIIPTVLQKAGPLHTILDVSPWGTQRSALCLNDRRGLQNTDPYDILTQITRFSTIFFLLKSLDIESKCVRGLIIMLATDLSQFWGQSQLVVAGCFCPFLFPEKKEWGNPQLQIGLPAQCTNLNMKPLLFFQPHLPEPLHIWFAYLIAWEKESCQ